MGRAPLRSSHLPSSPATLRLVDQFREKPPLPARHYRQKAAEARRAATPENPGGTRVGTPSGGSRVSRILERPLGRQRTRLLDVGVWGLHVPQVDTPEIARA